MFIWIAVSHSVLICDTWQHRFRKDLSFVWIIAFCEKGHTQCATNYGPHNHAVVNFINVLLTRFSYKSLFGSFFLFSNPKQIFVIFGAKILYKKCVRKTLMKLTPGVHANTGRRVVFTRHFNVCALIFYVCEGSSQPIERIKHAKKLWYQYFWLWRPRSLTHTV